MIPSRRDRSSMSTGLVLRGRFDYFSGVVSAEPLAYALLPQLTHEAARAASLLGRGIPGLSLDAIFTALERPLGARADVTPYAVETWPPGTAFQRADPNLVAVVIGDGIASQDRMVLELDPALAGYLVDRALGASAPEPRLAPGPATDGERGALAYLAAQALVHARESFRVLGVISTIEALAHALGDPQGMLVAIPARVELAGVVGWARLFRLPSSVRSAPHHPLDPSLPLELSIVLGQATLSAPDVAALDLGDVVVPETWTARPDPSTRIWTGAMRAMSPHGGPVLHLDAGPELVSRSIEEGPKLAPPKRPSEWRDAMSTANRVADVPVELSVEVGRIALTVGELSDLAPGAVLTTGLPTGQPLTLRAGARVIARGELVVVDGELGIRITELV